MMRMRKVILLGALSILTSVADASNFYVGGGLGLGSIVAKQTTNRSPEQHNLGGFGIVGGGFAGYNFNFCKSYDFGVEGFIYGNSANLKTLHHQNHTRLKLFSNFNYGVRVLPGFYLNSCLESHFIVGYTRAQFTLRDNIYHSLGITRTYNVNGYQIGGGLTWDMSRNVALRFDGVFNGYESLNPRRRYLKSSDPVRINFIVNDFDATFSLVYKF